MSVQSRARGTAARVLTGAALIMGLVVAPASVAFANGVPLQLGEVIAATGNGTFNHLSRTGTLIDTLNDTTGAQFTTGGCFNAAGDFVGTNFGAGNVSRFDRNGNLLNAVFAGGMASPESCTFDRAGNLWVGDAASTLLRKFSATGTLITSFTLATEDRGTDWIDLAADQCTFVYTSEGSSILSFNVCTNMQRPAFATGLSAPCFALRIRPNGEVLVACSSNVYRLSSTGAILHTYTGFGTGNLFSLNLDPDNTTFWTGDFGNDIIYHVDIATGAILTSFSSLPKRQLFGLAIVGEINVGSRDTTPPTCVISAVIAGPPKQLKITTRDTGSGLKSIQVIQSTNANTSVPAFTQGTTSPVVVTSTKVNQSTSATVALRVTDVAGNVTNCDPVMTEITFAPGGGVQRFTDLARAESRLWIYNDTPGLTALRAIVNGHPVSVTGLRAGETRMIDVSRFMRASNNTVTLVALGRVGGTATVLIADN